jgi:branched-chain amino acid transport system substrate-binding protein
LLNAIPFKNEMKKIIVVFCALIVFVLSCNNSRTIKLGATFPLTGEVASYGIHAKNGIQLKTNEINAKGGINGRLVEIDYQDDKNSIKDAVSIFNSFATIDKYPIVFGSAGSSVSLSLVPIANRQKVILMSPVSSSSQLSIDGGKFFFRTVPSDNLQAEMLANWVFSSNIRKVAIVYTNNSWGKPLTEGFRKIFTQLGGEVVFEEGVLEKSSDFRTIILKLKKKSFDAIVSPTYPKEGGIFVKQLRENGLITKLYGGDNWGSPEFLDIAQNSAEGVFFTFPSDSKSPLYGNFAENYNKTYKEDPDIIAAYGYDAATAIYTALLKSNSLNTDSIRKSLLTAQFEGVSGKIAFKQNGDVISEGYGKRTILNGKSMSIE